MDAGNWITIVVLLIGFVGNAAYLKGVFGTKIEANEKDIVELQEKVVYKDSCSPVHAEVNRRLGRLERIRNGN